MKIEIGNKIHSQTWVMENVFINKQNGGYDKCNETNLMAKINRFC